MKVLVVGANGRMGSFRSNLLRARGIEVVGYDIGGDKLLLDGTYDGYVIATPMGSHQELVTKLAPHSVPIFVEKPLSGSVKSIEEIFQAAGNTPLYVAWQRRMHSEFQEIKYDLDQQKGNWRQIKIVSYDNPTPAPHVLDIPNYIYSDYMGHDINEALWMADGELPESVIVVESNFVYRSASDNSLVILKYSGGRRVIIEGGIANPNNFYDQRLEVFTPKVVLKSSEITNKYSFPEFYNKAFSAEVDLFIKVMGNTAEFPEQRQQNINTAKVIEMVIAAKKD